MFGPARNPWLAAALCALLAAPLLLVDVPPLLDYPNHLARLMALAEYGRDPVLSAMFAPRWQVIPDLGIDLIGPPLVHILPVHVAGRLLIGLALLLPVIGTLAWHRAQFGTVQPWAFAVGLVAWHGTLLLGFLNFSIGIGLALLLATGWTRWHTRRPGFAMALVVPGAVGLFFCHLSSLVLFGLLAGAEEIAGFRRGSTSPVLRGLARLGAAFAVPAWLYLHTNLSSMATAADFGSLAEKARGVLLPVTNYQAGLDAVSGAALLLTLAIAALIGRVRIAPPAAIALPVLGVAYAITPADMKGVAHVDERFVIMAAFLVFAGLQPGMGRRAGLAVATVLAGLFCARLGTLALVWWGHRSVLADFRAGIADIPPGARVLVVRDDDDGAPSRRLANGVRTDTHLPALLVIERRAWWPFLFDNESQQPIRQAKALQKLALRIGSMPEMSEIGPDMLQGFDFLLVLEHPGAVPLQLPPDPNATEDAEAGNRR